ncbi:MAG: UDP-N-acetylmuramoyl-L-alanyl-D-glutamate--2,6-diaminopimelate ligase [Bdellovibrionota bacterium]
MNITDLFIKYPNTKPCQDHRILEAGDIFVAIKGSTFDAHGVLHEVIAKNPAVIVVQDSSAFSKGSAAKDFKGEKIIVQNSRAAFDQLCHAYFGSPSQKLFCVGVTGTNGKTTTSHMVEFALNQFNLGTGVIGTIDHHYAGSSLKVKKWETNLTAPGSLEFYSRLRDFVELGAKALSVEVSSHAIDQDRMSSCEFDVGIFTNLTRDHLDYHGDMEKYFKAKEKFFTEILKNSPKKSKYAVINQDDPYGRQIQIPKNVQKISYGEKNSDLTYEILEQSFAGQRLNINYQGKKYASQIHLSGQFNILNYLATLGVLLAKQMPLSKSIEIFSNFTGVRGRLEKVANNKGIHVFVDYAHTPDALENVLKTLGEIRKESKNDKKIITVFGCGGDRDKGKRPIMGEIASRMSDFAVITSDNPRTEDPAQIIKDVEAGCAGRKNYEIEVDRKKAIEKALNIAKNGDAVLIAGKGHEDYQIVGLTKHYFDDVEVVKEYLSK